MTTLGRPIHWLGAPGWLTSTIRIGLSHRQRPERPGLETGGLLRREVRALPRREQCRWRIGILHGTLRVLPEMAIPAGAVLANEFTPAGRPASGGRRGMVVLRERPAQRLEGTRRCPPPRRLSVLFQLRRSHHAHGFGQVFTEPVCMLGRREHEVAQRRHAPHAGVPPGLVALARPGSSDELVLHGVDAVGVRSGTS